MESAADLEVDRIMAELTAGVLAPASSAPSTAVKGPANAAAVGKLPAESEKVVIDLLSNETTIFYY